MHSDFFFEGCSDFGHNKEVTTTSLVAGACIICLLSQTRDGHRGGGVTKEISENFQVHEEE